jgi:HK97 family phage major capsid protein
MNNYTNLTDRTAAAGLITPEESRELIQDVARESTVLTNGRVVTMSTSQTRMPVMSALPSAYFVDGDTGLKQTTQAGFTNTTLHAEELAVIVPVPEAVLADANFDIFGELRPHLATAFGKALDAAVLFGVNKPGTWGDDIVTAATAAGNVVTAGTAIDLVADFSEAMKLVEVDGYSPNAFAASVGLRAELRDVADLQGQRIYHPGLTAGAPDTIYGAPARFARNGSWDSGVKAIVGDWSQLVVGVRQDLTFKVLDQAVLTDGSGNVTLNLAQQDAVALRCVMRVAFAVPVPVSHEAGSSRYPFAVITNPGS